MDSFEWNKIIGAVLGTAIFIFVVRVVAEGIYEPEKPAKPGYVVEGVVENPAGGTAARPWKKPCPIGARCWPRPMWPRARQHLPSAKPAMTRLPRKTIKIGPPLFGVVDRPRASIAGFSYSGGMKAKGGTWTYDELFKFLKSPGAYIPGTKMSFAGICQAEDRINLIAFLRTNADSPAAIPAPKPAAAAAPAAPADAKAAAAAPASAAAPAAAAKPADAAKPAAPAASDTTKKPGASGN